MVITKLNGKIVYYSPMHVGAHDQSHWNELELRNWFKGKEYGVMGDGGFTFNRASDEDKIVGYKPYKKPKGGSLTLDKKTYNRKLSQIRVVVENAIRHIKQWKILASTFQHWRNGQGQISADEILSICITLANWKIHQNPIRKDDWIAPSLQDQDEVEQQPDHTNNDQQ